MLAAACGVVSGIAGFVMGGALFSATWKLVAKNKYMELQWVRILPWNKERPLSSTKLPFNAQQKDIIS